ncbi:MAG TPA: hypothetical protein PKD96_02255, partial [Candidatus Absconditabacterales bacterium]|nr:hypothetical protein [Candidatus Absconditabacterales bacterium]
VGALKYSDEFMALAGKIGRYNIKVGEVLSDKDTILSVSEIFSRTNKRFRGATIYTDQNGRYFYRDTLHTGPSSHLEVFDKNGNHLGEADPITGELIEGTKDVSKKLDKDYR